MQRYLKLIVLFVLLFGMGFFAVTQKGMKSTPTPSQNVLGNTNIASTSGTTVIIDYGDTKVTYTNIEGKTVFDVLKKITAEKNIPLEYTQYDFGVFIKTIGNKTNTKELSWVYYVNDKSADVASDKYELKQGDKVEWKFGKPSY